MSHFVNILRYLGKGDYLYRFGNKINLKCDVDLNKIGIKIEIINYFEVRQTGRRPRG